MLIGCVFDLVIWFVVLLVRCSADLLLLMPSACWLVDVVCCIVDVIRWLCDLSMWFVDLLICWFVDLLVSCCWLIVWYDLLLLLTLLIHRFVGLSIEYVYFLTCWLNLLIWFVGLLLCWFGGLLVCWFVDLLTCWLGDSLIWWIGLTICCFVGLS